MSALYRFACERAINTVTVADIDELSDIVITSYTNLLFTGPLDEGTRPVEYYVTEPGAQFVASRVIAGSTVPQNLATAKALFLAARSLDNWADTHAA